MCGDVPMCDQKITTGNAINRDDDWNISESKDVQRTLSSIIHNHTKAKTGNKEKSGDRIPKYIQNLFDHYCSRCMKPQFQGIDQLQHKLFVPLQRQIFVDPKSGTGDDNEEETPVLQREDTSRKVSHEKVKLLFPNAMQYINEKGEQISMAPTNLTIFVEPKVA